MLRCRPCSPWRLSLALGLRRILGGRGLVEHTGAKGGKAVGELVADVGGFLACTAALVSADGCFVGLARSDGMFTKTVTRLIGSGRKLVSPGEGAGSIEHGGVGGKPLGPGDVQVGQRVVRETQRQ